MASGPLDCYIGAATGGHRMSIVIARGAEADAVLGDAAFRAKWAALHPNCPWSSVFQSPAFAATWYRVYKPAFEPVLVFREARSAGLSGLLPLAVARDSGTWQLAGAPQAEYQAWLALPKDGQPFICEALTALRESGMTGPLTFTYLPRPTRRWTGLKPRLGAGSARSSPGLGLCGRSARTPAHRSRRRATRAA